MKVKIEGVYFNYCLATLAIRKQCIFAEKGSLRGFRGLRLATIRESKLNVLKAQEQGKKRREGKTKVLPSVMPPLALALRM